MCTGSGDHCVTMCTSHETVCTKSCDLASKLCYTSHCKLSDIVHVVTRVLGSLALLVCLRRRKLKWTF